MHVATEKNLKPNKTLVHNGFRSQPRHGAVNIIAGCTRSSDNIFGPKGRQYGPTFEESAVRFPSFTLAFRFSRFRPELHLKLKLKSPRLQFFYLFLYVSPANASVDLPRRPADCHARRQYWEPSTRITGRALIQNFAFLGMIIDLKLSVHPTSHVLPNKLRSCCFLCCSCRSLYVFNSKFSFPKSSQNS